MILGNPYRHASIVSGKTTPEIQLSDLHMKNVMIKPTSVRPSELGISSATLLVWLLMATPFIAAEENSRVTQRAR